MMMMGGFGGPDFDDTGAGASSGPEESEGETIEPGSTHSSSAVIRHISVQESDTAIVIQVDRHDTSGVIELGRIGASWSDQRMD